jgi:esterase/lipase
MEKARLEQTSSHKQNDADWQAQMAQYEKQLAHHGAEMSRYQADLQAQQSEWQLKNITYAMGKWSQKQDKYFAEFDKSMQGSMNQFTNDMASWDKEFQDKTKGLEYIAQGQAAAIGNFDKNMAKYAADVKLLADEYQQNEILRKWEKYKFDYTQSLSKFSAEMQSNLHTFNEQNTRLTAELTIAQTNANNIQSALMGQMSADTELSKNNEAQRLAMDLQTFQQDLTAFNANMSKYQNEVGTIAGRYNVEMSAATSNMTNNQNIFNADLQVFQNKQQALEKLLGGLRQEYAESIGVIIKPKQGE